MPTGKSLFLGVLQGNILLVPPNTVQCTWPEEKKILTCSGGVP